MSGTRWRTAAGVLVTAVLTTACTGPARLAPTTATPVAQGAHGGAGMGRAATFGAAVRARVPVTAALTAVSCPSARVCVTVGSIPSKSPVVLRWKGTRWADVPVPRPVTGSLSAIWCGSATSCLAVGATKLNAPRGTSAPLAERWNGRAWTVLPVPSPAHTVQSSLTGIDCTSPIACTAVGYYTTAKSGYNPVPTYALAEGWNGQVWRLEPAVNQTPRATMLSSVSCSSATACTAVFEGDLAAERWNGTVWTAQDTKPSSGGGTESFNSVSCPAASNCTAVGDSGGDDNQGLSEVWDGRSWGWPYLAPESDGSTFSGVTCFSGTSCLAVGGYGRQRGEVTLAARWNGKSWSALPTPNVPRPALNSTLGAISCASPTACMAVGNSDRGIGKTGYATHERALAEWWNGTKWRILPTPSRH
jgi:hypothetical protein